MIDLSVLPQPKDDGRTHINTLMKGKTKLGRLLSPTYNLGEPIHLPMLGNFRTIENLWWYLNTGGARDNIRSMEPHSAINFARLITKKYSCDKFRELIIDATIIKLQSNNYYVNLMTESELPFDHYYLNSQSSLPIRPARSVLYASCMEDVRKILRGQMKHTFVNFNEMNFTELKSE